MKKVTRNMFMTLLRKEVSRFMRIWPQTLIPPVITTMLYFVIFGNLIGSRIGEMNGHPYINFIVPGLIMMAVVNNSYSNVVSSFFSSKFQSYIEEMLVTPMPNLVILLGFVSGGVIRGLLVGSVVFIVSLFFAELNIYSLLYVIVFALLTAVMFSLGGFIHGIFARNFDDVSIVPTFILTPLIYLGGVFYSIDLLPPFWKSISLMNPIFYMIDGFRFGFIGTSDLSPIYSVLMLTGGCIISFTIALKLLNQGRGIRT